MYDFLMRSSKETYIRMTSKELTCVHQGTTKGPARDRASKGPAKNQYGVTDSKD